MTKDVWLLLDGIIAACHGGKNSETFELLKNRARNGDIYHHDFLDDFSLTRNITLKSAFKNGNLNEGDWIIILDVNEYINPLFVERLRKELIPAFEGEDISVVYQSSKCVLFRYNRDIIYHNSVHTGITGFVGSAVDLSQEPDFVGDKHGNKNWIWSERDNELSWVKGSQYYLWPNSNHINLVYEPHRFPHHPRKDELSKDHTYVRFKFLNYCNKNLKFSATKDGLIEYMRDSSKWTQDFIEFLEYEKILKTFYRYYVLNEDYKTIFETEDAWSIKEHLKNKKM